MAFVEFSFFVFVLCWVFGRVCGETKRRGRGSRQRDDEEKERRGENAKGFFLFVFWKGKEGGRRTTGIFASSSLTEFEAVGGVIGGWLT